MSKNRLRWITLVRGPIWGIHSLTLMISCGYPVGQHPLVVQLLKGMLNMRPPKPRYTHTWAVHLVTKYLACLGKAKLLPLKLLSIKLTMLFALSCLERALSLTKLDLWPCRVAPEGVFFTLVSPRKQAEALRLNYLKPFLRPFRTTRDSVPLAIFCHYLKATQFFHLQSQILCLFLTSNRIIQSLHPLWADGCGWS